MELVDESPRINKNNSTRLIGHKKENDDDMQQMRPKSRIGTPSLSSDASWNTQTASSPSYVRNPSQDKQKKVNERWFFNALRCNGSCSHNKAGYIDPHVVLRAVHGRDYGKEDIRIDDNPVVFRRKQSQPKIQVKEEYIAAPIMNLGMQTFPVKKQLVMEENKEEYRISLDVFGSNKLELKEGDIALNLERKLSMLNWDAIPNSPRIPSTSVNCQMYECMESDSSSDLFEIESISGGGQALFTRQAYDGMPAGCMTPYSPSETSVEWSVVTASAADFSVISDYDKKLAAENMRNPAGLTTTSKVGRTKSIMDKDVQKGKQIGLLRCTSHKAVRVAEPAHRSDVKAKPHQPQLKTTDFP
ncbi:hypothetical protein CFOL_v3_01362 [Cephalotus follicularis]|uniref:Uncharacterized protein n=1 Tax=Cephalotus follicularis TaxID=3775 RepID=A0A1Q3AQ05_CEPFO|nr:hypothetical protein CFOL_v3_01362 [Cephalotus follicularis]